MKTVCTIVKSINKSNSFSDQFKTIDFTDKFHSLDIWNTHTDPLSDQYRFSTTHISVASIQPQQISCVSIDLTTSFTNEYDSTLLSSLLTSPNDSIKIRTTSSLTTTEKQHWIDFIECERAGANRGNFDCNQQKRNSSISAYIQEENITTQW